MKTLSRQPKRSRGHRPPPAQSRRRGSLYVAVLMVGALVSVLGMSALLVGRVTQRAHTGIADTVAARMNAHAAIRLAMLEIEDNPDWRFAYPDENWYQDRSLGSGTFSLTVSDPSDDDLTDAAADPIVLTGVGRQGHAVHRTQVTLAPLHRGYDCLSSAIHGGDDVRFFDAQASADHDVTANDDISASNSYVTGQYAAVDRVTGSTFVDTATGGHESKEMPNSADVLQFYEDHGTWIDATDLPNRFPNVIRNGGFEAADEFWQAADATLLVDSSTAAEGSHCLQITDRASESAGVIQDVTQQLTSGRDYTASFAVRVDDVNTVLYGHMLISDANGTRHVVSGPITAAVPDVWFDVQMNVQPTFASPVSSVTLWINTSSDDPTTASAANQGNGNGNGNGRAALQASPADFRIDRVQVRESGSIRNIDHVLLSPQHNPFGELNSRGIYLLDMQGRQLIVRNSRICGTLVVLDAADDSRIGDDHPLRMSPAVPGYPTLLIFDGQCTINPADRGLSESALQVNLNPAGAPFEQIGSDDDLDDAYASGIDGLIYASERLLLGNLDMRGVVISNNDVVIRGRFSIQYDNRYYRNPPPGFSGPEQIRILLGSARRTIE